MLNPNGLCKFTFTDELGNLCGRLRRLGFKNFELDGKKFDEGLKILSLKFEKFATGNKIPDMGLMRSKLAQIGAHFLHPEGTEF